MSLTADSTLEEVQAEYENNADYDIANDGAGDAAKCRLFIHAARIYLRRMAEEVERGGSGRVKDTYLKIESELSKAEAWRAKNDTTASTQQHSSSVRHVDFTGFRE